MGKLTLLLLLLPFLSFSQTDAGAAFPLKDGKIVYESAVDVPGVKKDTIYKISKIWIADNFKAGKSTMETDDNNAGLVTGNVTTLVALASSNLLYQSAAFELNFNVQIVSKNNHYQIQFYHISTKSAALGSMTSDTQVPLETFARAMQDTRFKPKQLERDRQMKKAIDDQFTKLMDSFYDSVKKSAGIMF